LLKGTTIEGPELAASPVRVTSTEGLIGSVDSTDTVIFNEPVE